MTALRTTVIGSYPFPGWLEFAAEPPRRFRRRRPRRAAGGRRDRRGARPGRRRARRDHRRRADAARLQPLASTASSTGSSSRASPPRRFGPPAHDQRGRTRVVGELAAPRGLGAVDEFERLRRLAPPGPTLKARVPGPYTLARPARPERRYPTAGRSPRRCCRSSGASSTRSSTPGCEEIASTSRR